MSTVSEKDQQPCTIAGVARSAGFYVVFSGDESVGIFPVEWKIEGDFEFECQEDFETFKCKLAEAWEYASDTPIGIESFEERIERIKKEDKWLRGD